MAKVNKKLSGFKHLPKPLLKIIHYPPQVTYALGLGAVLGKFVPLLTTIGRSSGKLRVTPLQYEEIDGRMHLGSAFGKKSDWVENIIANPTVDVQIKSRKFTRNAVVFDDPSQIIDFLLIRYERHPKMIGRIMKSQGIPIPPSHKDLQEYPKGMALVVIDPFL